MPEYRTDATAGGAEDEVRHDTFNDTLKKRAALFSLLAAIFLTSMKLGVGLYTNSLAILSEALHSGLDLLAALMTYYAIRVSSRPADRRHPYGHGRVENLSALAETLLLFGVCLWVGWEGVHRLMEGTSPVVPSVWGVAVMAVSMLVDIGRVRNLRKVARVTNSQALEADALHFSTDILSSAVVFLGVGAVWAASYFDFPPEVRAVVHQADTVAALIVAVVIFKVSLTMARQALDFLMDAAPEEVEENIEKAASAVDGVRRVSRLRMRSSGPKYFVDLSVDVSDRLSVGQGHRIASEVEERVKALLPMADVLVHVDPSRDERPATFLETVQNAAVGHELDLHDLRILRHPDGAISATAHVEVPGKSDFGTWYVRCKRFEREVHRAFPHIRFVTHLEPDQCQQVSKTLVPGKDPMADFALERVRACVENEPLVSHMHAFACYRTTDGLDITFHCHVCQSRTVREVHDVTERMEKTLRAEMEFADSILIHVEPCEETARSVEAPECWDAVHAAQAVQADGQASDEAHMARVSK